MRISLVIVFLLIAGLGAGAAPAVQHEPPALDSDILIDDFEGDRTGVPPDRWIYISKSGNEIPLERMMDDNEHFLVVEEGGNKFVRAFTRAEAQRITVLTDEKDLEWDLRSYSRLRWDWRAHQLPEGASERDQNDAGAALYVTFDTDWLGRPRSIKYTYSSTLPVGSVVDFGRLKVIVVSSGANGIGAWRTVERNVLDDYRRVFDRDPPETPVSITLWSDSDDTGGIAEVDFDNIVLLKE
jgi:hypothetical protein